jgi:hypothetical protein
MEVETEGVPPPIGTSLTAGRSLPESSLSPKKEHGRKVSPERAHERDERVRPRSGTRPRVQVELTALKAKTSVDAVPHTAPGSPLA